MKIKIQRQALQHMYIHVQYIRHLERIASSLGIKASDLCMYIVIMSCSPLDRAGTLMGIVPTLFFCVLFLNKDTHEFHDAKRLKSARLNPYLQRF